MKCPLYTLAPIQNGLNSLFTQYPQIPIRSAVQSQNFKFEDYIIEEVAAECAGGILVRAFSPSENAGRGRRDFIYAANNLLANDVNALDQLRDLLEKSIGITHSGLLSPITSAAPAGELFVVSEWVPGIPLSHLMKIVSESGESWPVPVTLHLIGEIAKVLCFLHATPDPITGKINSFVHGQVRPENIFISFSGKIKLLNLGMAELESFALQGKGGHREGMANYASPELASGREVDGRSDLFSLGAILWELLTGRPLFASNTREEWVRILAEKTPPPPSQSSPQVPKELDAVASKLLDRDKYLRYELGEKAAQDMEAVLKYLFPDFNASKFSEFCEKHCKDLRDSYLESIQRSDNSHEETRVNFEPGAPKAAPVVSEKPKVAVAVENAKAIPAAGEPQPWLMNAEPERVEIPKVTASALKPILAICAVLLVALPFAVPQVLKILRTKRAIAQQRSLKAREKHATLHLLSREVEFSVQINGHSAEVIDGRVDVPAERELIVRVEKPGYEDIETTTQLLPDEDLDLPLEFKKSAYSEDSEVAKDNSKPARSL